MIGWYTDSALSHTVLSSISGIECRHISEFYPCDSVFYGLLRGASRCMHILRSIGIDFYYVDNGYFGAEYVNRKMVKKTTGYYRVVKNDMIETYQGQSAVISKHCESALILPPSPYTAMFYDTTPEDWIASVAGRCRSFEVRKKDNVEPLEDAIARHDCGIAFNSMAVVKAVELGKPAYDTHGIFKNMHHYPNVVSHDYADMVRFYESRQYTLEEMKAGKIVWM